MEKDPRFIDLGIYTFDYYTGPLSGSYCLGDVVDCLKENLRIDGLYRSKRIVFICHSMGGIVARKFIVDRVLDLLSAKISVSLFLVASPSLGSHYANFFAALAKFLHNTQLDSLRFSQENLWLNDLDKNFRNLIHRAGHFRDSLCLHVGGKELIEDKFIELKKFPLLEAQIVPPFTGGAYFGEVLKIPGSDHLSIAKPESADCFQNKVLCQFIEDQMGIVPTSSILEASSGECEVKLIKDAADPDLMLALHLYEDRIPESERFESSDIVRWIRDDIAIRDDNGDLPRDFFLVEKCGKKVEGCLLVHCYPKQRFAFFAYLVADKARETGQQRISHKLLSRLDG